MVVKHFGPSKPQLNKNTKQQHRFWGSVGSLVKKHPGWIAIIIGVVLIAGIANIPSMKYSFNELESFPEDMSSRKGFDYLAEHYQPGQLAPVEVLLESEEAITTDDKETLKNIQNLEQNIASRNNVASMSPELDDDMTQGDAELLDDFLSDDGTVIKLSLTLDSNPYVPKALDTIKDLRDSESDLISDK